MKEEEKIHFTVWIYLFFSFQRKKEKKKFFLSRCKKKKRKRQRKDLLTTLNLCTEVTDIYMFYRTSGSGLPAKNDLNSTSDLSGCEKGAS